MTLAQNWPKTAVLNPRVINPHEQNLGENFYTIVSLIHDNSER